MRAMTMQNLYGFLGGIVIKCNKSTATCAE